MAEVFSKYDILIQGYAFPADGAYFASPTTTLIHTADGRKVLVDPGASSEKLVAAFQERNMQFTDINILFLTHYHPDHWLNIKYFPHLPMIDPATKWSSDREDSHSGESVADTEIKILKTPGHSDEHCSLLINTADEGVVCIAQDVFWWEDGKQKVENLDELMNLEDPFANDVDALRKSRELVLGVADVIIPGHGKPFKNLFKSEFKV